MNDDDLLAAVLAGDVRVDDPRVAELPTDERERLDALLRVQREIAADAAREREMLAEVEELAQDGPPPAVEEFLARVAGTPAAPAPAPRPMRWRRVAGIAALAAGLLLLAETARRTFADADEARPSAGSGTLGPRADLEAIAPVGAVERLDSSAPFRWKGDLPRLGHFVLSVWSHDAKRADGKGDLLARRELTTGEWTPDVALTDHVHWRVDLVPFEGSALSGAEVEAWQRR